MKGEKRNLGSIRYFGEQSLRIIGKERERERRKRGGVKKRMPVEKAVIRGERGELNSIKRAGPTRRKQVLWERTC